MEIGAGQFLAKRPPFTLGEIRYGTQYCFMSVDKARRELGYAPRDVGISVRDAIRWFRENGYAPARP